MKDSKLMWFAIVFGISLLALGLYRMMLTKNEAFAAKMYNETRRHLS